MMNVFKLLSLVLAFQLLSCQSIQVPPTRPAIAVSDKDAAQLYGELFEEVQLKAVFRDSKHFVDMNPQKNPDEIMKQYRLRKPQTKENLHEFVNANFNLPEDPMSSFQSKKGEPIDLHIRRLWKYLRRDADLAVPPASSLIGLPYSYIVPGGRFREIYYWDSYFTQLGLLVDGEDEMFKNMVKNFQDMALTLGKIPNGNRDYYRGRSQPPFFSHMISLWQKRFGSASAVEFIEALKKEHQFWMSGPRLVPLEGGSLNRYWDDRDDPRPEAFKEDVALADRAYELFKRPKKETYRELRAGAESGWDFSTRWFKDPKEFASIQTTSFIPVDLNSLLVHLEEKISELSHDARDFVGAKAYAEMAQNRREMIQRYLWNEKMGCFSDYNWRTKIISSEITLAMVVPLFIGIATKEQAQQTAQILENKFLRAGGLVTTLRTSGQQWDAPNGWAPHQWMAFVGLKRYKINSLAEKIRRRWMALNQRVYKSTGKMMEKYNVVDIQLESGGGEYPLQDGFGWTNGVYKALSTFHGSKRNMGDLSAEM